MCAYNRTVAKVDQFLENEAKGTHHTQYSVREIESVYEIECVCESLCV